MSGCEKEAMLGACACWGRHHRDGQESCGEAGHNGKDVGAKDSRNGGSRRRREDGNGAKRGSLGRGQMGANRR